VDHSPATRNALIDLVRQWHQDATPWVPSGMGSRLHWGPTIEATPDVLSCRALQGVIDHAVDDLTITVEAGLSLADLQSLLAREGQWLPVDWPRGTDPQELKTAGSIGGLVARGLAGGLRQRHLGMRDQIIGIGLLRTDGTIAKAGGRVVKNVAGYDLMRLLCGSWGSLALITELTLKVQPIRPAHAALHLQGGVEELERFRAGVLRSTLTPERCDWWNEGDNAWTLRLLVSSVSDQAVQDQLSRLASLGQQHQLSAEQHACDNPLNSGRVAEAMHWLVRVVLPPAALASLLISTECAALQGWHWDLAAGAGCGDGWQPQQASATKAATVIQLRRRVEELGGRLTVLQQPDASVDRIPCWLDAPARTVIEAVKQQFDPKRQLSPGRLPGVAG
jgi:glycolate oxidase FAD binding subunit